MNNEKKGKAFRFFKWIFRIFSPKVKLNQELEQAKEGIVYVANHSKAFSPIAVTLHFPVKNKIWITQEVLEYKGAWKYVYSDFFLQNGKAGKINKFLAKLLSPLLVLILRGSKNIGVEKGLKISKTFNATVDALEKGYAVVIFPESPVAKGKFVNDFHEGFLMLARVYQKKTGKPLKFAPMYIAPQLNTFNIGKEVTLSENFETFKENCHETKDQLFSKIENLASNLPPHKIISYNGEKKVSKKKKSNSNDENQN